MFVYIYALYASTPIKIANYHPPQHSHADLAQGYAVQLFIMSIWYRRHGLLIAFSNEEKTPCRTSVDVLRSRGNFQPIISYILREPFVPVSCFINLVRVQNCTSGCIATRLLGPNIFNWEVLF